MNFSVLMSVYKGDKPKWLDEAIISITIDQFIKPTEIIFVIDGPVSQEIKSIIKKHQLYLTVYELKENVGLTKALDFGITKCTYEWVARMDSDDISHSLRFKKQLDYILRNQSIDVVGTCLGKFINTPEKIYSTICRKNPYKLVKFRTPMSHATVFYKKSVVLGVGGYQGAPNKMEDYWLWIKMIKNEINMDTIQEVLYFMRSDYNADIRRGGKDFFLNEIKLQKEMRKLNIINEYEFIRNIIIKGTFRLIPSKMRSFIYKYLIGRK